MNTATSPDSQWLFPGGRVSQPLTAGALRQRFYSAGVAHHPTLNRDRASTRPAGPAPVVAKALRYSPGTTAGALRYTPGTTKGHREAAGGTWSRYAATSR